MHISAPFIRRPVGTSLLSLALLLGGAVGYVLLPVSSLPEVEFPTINVNARLPGASPETAASSIATPLERQFGRIAGVTEMTSSSTLGGSNITLQFDLNRDINGAARDVQAAINAARAASRQHAAESGVLEVQPGGRAHHDSGAHLDTVEPAGDLRRR